MDDATTWTLLAAASFVPPFAFMAWVRSRERHGREPFGSVVAMFLYGATLGVAAALLLSGVVGLSGVTASFAIAAVIVAPLVEEACKGVGLRFVRFRIDEMEDGLVYGAAAGLGFAATETFLYGTTALLEDGAQNAFSLIVARTLSSMLLHATSSALLGFGYSVLRLRRGGPSLGLAYAAAVILHGTYNFIVLSSTWLGFLCAVVLVAVVWSLLMRKLRALDARPSL